jgi:hypothetical protein
MKLQDGFRLLVIILISNVSLSEVARAATATGTVKDSSGEPVAGATVLVYSAGVRKGYNIFCPTCYVDCGKRVTTDQRGNFSIADLDNELVFNLITMQKGFVPTWIRDMDPQRGAAPPVVMKTRPLMEATSSVHGRIVDAHGNGVPDALVEVKGIGAGAGRVWGNFPDGLAISDADGSFALGTIAWPIPGHAPTDALMLEVKPRGMAPALHTATVGAEHEEFKVNDGVTVHGRLLSKGKPVPNAQLVLNTLDRSSDNAYAPIYIGTDEKGSFAITNVPIGRVWSLDADSDSLAGIGSVATRYVATRTDGKAVNAGDMKVNPGHSLSGGIVLSDGKAIPPDMRVSISNTTGGRRNAILSADARFEFKGLSGPYMLVPAVRGYRLDQGSSVEVLVDRDIDGLVIRLEPAPAPPSTAMPLPTGSRP